MYNGAVFKRHKMVRNHTVLENEGVLNLRPRLDAPKFKTIEELLGLGRAKQADEKSKREDIRQTS